MNSGAVRHGKATFRNAQTEESERLHVSCIRWRVPFKLLCDSNTQSSQTSILKKRPSSMNTSVPGFCAACLCSLVVLLPLRPSQAQIPGYYPGDTVVVAGGEVRDTTSIFADVLVELSRGDTVAVTNTRPDYIQIEHRSRQGWLSKRQVMYELTDGGSEKPVAHGPDRSETHYAPSQEERRHQSGKRQPERASNVVARFSSSGAKTTRPFSVSGSWEVRWETSAEVFFLNGFEAGNPRSTYPAMITGPNAPSRGSSYIDRGGRYYLKIQSSGPWTVTVVRVR
jgi:hypothetical protein